MASNYNVLDIDLTPTVSSVGTTVLTEQLLD